MSNEYQIVPIKSINKPDPQALDGLLNFLPGTTHLNNQYFEFNLNCRTEGNIIVYDSEFRMKATTISPEEYPAYYTSCETLGTDFSDEVVFRKKNQNRD